MLTLELIHLGHIIIFPFCASPPANGLEGAPGLPPELYRVGRKGGKKPNPSSPFTFYVTILMSFVRLETISYNILILLSATHALLMSISVELYKSFK